MRTRAGKAFRIGIFATVCTAAALLSIGCESSTEMAVDPDNPMCPICGSRTQAQRLADVGGTKAVCPLCGQAMNVSQRFLDRLEIFTGASVGDTVYACAMCGTIVEQCATCRQKTCMLTSRNTQ